MMKKIVNISIGLILFFVLSCNVVDKLTNTPPLVESISAEKIICNVGDTLWVRVQVSDPDDDPVTASWTADGGFFISNQGIEVDWVAPKTAGYYTLIVTVRDDKGGEMEERISITVLPLEKPVVRITQPQDGAYFTALGSLTITVSAEPANFVGVEFYLDDVKRLSDPSPPFTMDWPLDGLSGPLRIKAVAFRLDSPGIQSADSIRVSIEGVIPVPRIKQ
ncbi:hypothetical protein JXO59_01355 [candidate division KSB1 bacterium]|nr:hypothetical protein [candidate division KSB1 bacterium]